MNPDHWTIVGPTYHPNQLQARDVQSEGYCLRPGVPDIRAGDRDLPKKLSSIIKGFTCRARTDQRSRFLGLVVGPLLRAPRRLAVGLDAVNTELPANSSGFGNLVNGSLSF